MSNSLLSTRFFDKIVENELVALEREIKDFMEREQCEAGELTIESRYFPRPGEPWLKVRRIKPDEKWLNWLSENH